MHTKWLRNGLNCILLYSLVVESDGTREVLHKLGIKFPNVLFTQSYIAENHQNTHTATKMFLERLLFKNSFAEFLFAICIQSFFKHLIF